MKRNVLTITYFVDPKYKRHVEIPVARVGTMLIVGLILVVWSIVSAVKIVMPAPDSALIPTVESPSPSSGTYQMAAIKAEAVNATVLTLEDSGVPPETDQVVMSDSAQKEMEHSSTVIEGMSHKNSGRDDKLEQETIEESSARGVLPQAENLEPIVLDPLAPATLPVEAAGSSKDDKNEIKAEKPSAESLSMRFGAIRLVRDKSELRAEISLINTRSDGQAIAGWISGEAIYVGEDGASHSIPAQRELKFSALRQTVKSLVFPNPPAGRRFNRVDLRARDAVTGAVAGIEKSLR